MSSQYQRSVPLEVRRAEGERVRAKHPDKIPVSLMAGNNNNTCDIWVMALGFSDLKCFRHINNKLIIKILHKNKRFILFYYKIVLTKCSILVFSVDNCGESCTVPSPWTWQKEIPCSFRPHRWNITYTAHLSIPPLWYTVYIY